MTSPTPVPTPRPRTTSSPADTAGSSAATGLPAATLAALGVALAAEQAAVWSYGVVAAYNQGDTDLITGIRAGHLARRDATAGIIVAGKGRAKAPAISYSLPVAVNDVATARQLSTVIETDCAAAWRAVLGATDDGVLRTIALAGLSDSAVWLVSLKIAAKDPNPTVPFPGQA